MERRLEKLAREIARDVLDKSRAEMDEKYAGQLSAALADASRAESRRSDAMGRLAVMEQTATAAVKAAEEADAARVRADVRAEQWEAIAKELIARGAGRPKPEQQEKEENPLAKRIREESNGDASLAAHFWNYARELRNAGKKDEEIVGMIGWDVVGPEQEAK